MIDHRSVITENFVIILPVCLSMTLTICYTLPTYLARQAWANSVSSGSSLFATHSAIFTQQWVVNCTCSNFRQSMVRCLNTKGKYGKVTDTEIKWSIIRKSITTVIFVEFIDQLIDYPINCASLSKITGWMANSADPDQYLIWVYNICSGPYMPYLTLWEKISQNFGPSGPHFP